MFGDVKVRAQAEIIADPRKLIAEIEAIAMTMPHSQDVLIALRETRRLVIQASQIETVEVQVSAKELDAFRGEEFMDYVQDKLRTTLGDRLVRVVGPVVSVLRDEE